MDSDQVVAEAQVQQFPFPDRVLVHDGRAFHVDDIGILYPFRDLVHADGLLVDDISLGRQHPERDGQDAEIPGGSDIDIHQETVRVRDGTARSGDGVRKGTPAAVQEARGFDKEDFADAFGSVLPEDGGVVVHRIRGRLLHQPGSRVGMTLMDDDQGPQADGFEAAGIQEGGIQASGQFGGQNVFGEANPLPLFRKGCGRIGIRQFLLEEGVKHGRHLAAHPVGIAGLVTVQGRVAGQAGQFPGGILQHGTDGGMVRQHESGEQFGRIVHALPEIVRQQGNRKILFGDLRLPLRAGNRHHPLDPFRQIGQERRGRLNADMVQGHLPLRPDLTDDGLVSGGKRRIETDGQAHVRQERRLRISEDNTADGGDAVLHPGITEALGIIGLDDHCLRR